VGDVTSDEAEAARGGPDADYPSVWEADVVLRDGRTARLRPIRSTDAAALRQFHSRLSQQTVYFRFFAPHPTLSDDEVATFTHVDYRDRVALVIELQGQLLGVGRFDRLDAASAEVAFVIRDDHQGLGLGSLLLEHLAAIGRENGIECFVADVLPANSRMLATFRFAGYTVAQGYDEGVISLRLELAPTDASERVRYAREQRNEARSLWPLLRPRDVVVVGVSRRPGSIGHTFLRNLITGGFTGRIHLVHPEAEQILGVSCVRSLAEVPTSPDLVVLAVPAEEVPAMIDQAAAASARSVLVVSGGFETRDSAIGIARQARAAGMRLLGPASLGLVNTDATLSLNASLLPELPPRGRFGFFSQSGALALDILHRMTLRGIGVSTFVSAGHRADVSGNDLLQFWEEDDDTEVVMLYLETVGNPRKFARLAGRLSRRKPVVVLRTTGARLRHPQLGTVLGGPDEGDVGGDAIGVRVDMTDVEQIIDDSGIIDVASIEQMLDVAEVLRIRGDVGSGRIGIVGNSEAVAILAENAALQAGLTCAPVTRILARGGNAHQFRRALDDTVRDEAVDVVVALYVPPVESHEDLVIHDLLAELAGAVSKPVVAVLLGWSTQNLREAARLRGRIGLPVFSDVEHALGALGKVVGYHLSRTRSEMGAREDTGNAHRLSGCDARAVQALVEEVRTRQHAGPLSSPEAITALGYYGIHPRDQQSSSDADADCRIAASRDPLLGPMVTFGLDGWVAAALHDRHAALAPLTTAEARRLVRKSVAALADPETGRPRCDVEGLADLVRRAGAMVHDQSGIDAVELRGLAGTPPGFTEARVTIGSEQRAHLAEARALGPLPEADPMKPGQPGRITHPVGEP
jgi:acyl-CoA synthetase (NDP forming)/GNAT superfamily N-acetyltransferase